MSASCHALYVRHAPAAASYRSFCTKQELMQSLIDRYNIPDPPFIRDDVLYRRFVKSYVCLASASSSALFGSIIFFLLPPPSSSLAPYYWG